MNCIIPGLNVKVLAKALQALAKIGDELFIKATREKLILVTLNLRKTVCVQYHFLDSFFSSFELDRNDEHNDQNEAVSCTIHMKVFLPLFKGTHIEKKFDFIKLQYESNSDILILKMKYKCDDIIMVHKLRLMESLTVEFSPETGCNTIVATSTFFNQLLTMFSNTDDEITLEFFKGKVIARNYILGGAVRPKCVRSQVDLNSSEFATFQIKKETNINFSLKPFRTAIQFAEGFNLNIGLNFEVGGRPLIVLIKNPTFEANFIVATLDPYSDPQSTMATSSIPAKITEVRREEPNISVEDQEALQNENWDEFDLDSEPAPKKKSDNLKKSFEQLMSKVNQKSNDKDARNCCADKPKSTKKFNLVLEPPSEMNGPDPEPDDILPPSPESPRTKKAKLVFGRCFEPTFSETYLGAVLAPNSDSE